MTLLLFFIYLFIYFFFGGGVRNTNIFWGDEDFGVVVTTKIEQVLGVISMYFRVFSEGKCTE